MDDATSPNRLGSPFPCRFGNRSSVVLERERHPAGEVPVQTVTAHQFCLHLGPSAQLEVEQDGISRRGQFQGGHLIYTPPGASCGKPWAEARESLTLTLNPELVAHTAQEMGLADLVAIPRFRFRDPFVEQVGIELWSEFLSERHGTELYAELLASALAQHLVRSRVRANSRPGKSIRPLAQRSLRRVLDLLEDRLADNVRLADLATAAGMSAGHFARAFRQSTGQSPHQYLLARRVERAKHLLAHSRRPPVEIALELGFASRTHFTKVFRQHTAATERVP